MRALWEGWKELAGYIGDFQSRLILTVFYFTILAPFALIASIMGAGLTKTIPTWQPRAPRGATLEDARSQY